MSSLNQLISEIAHSIRQPDSVPVRRAIKLSIIHARNDLIRKSYGNHNYTDKVLKQRYKITLINVPDGDLIGTANLGFATIKRSATKVPKPTRLTNGIPFHSVRTVGVINPINLAFAQEGIAKCYKSLPGMECVPTYDYINEYLYVNNLDPSIRSLIIESVFEYPHIIEIETSDADEPVAAIDDDDEFLLPEDMIDAIKQIVLETFNASVIRDTNEVNDINLVK